MEFPDVIDHEREKRMIADYVRSGRFPHALIFSGPPGIGKRTMALALAQYLLCNNKKGRDECSSCKKIEKGVHPDLMVFGGNEEILGIEVIRGLSSQVQKSPYLSDRRVVIIDDAHFLTTEANNALLKTLEECKEFNLFILVTSKEQDIPFTVRSRCVKIPFSPVRAESIKRYLVEKKGLDEKKAEIISRLSSGSLSAALFWADEENFLMRRKIAECIFGTRKSYIEITSLSESISKKETEMYLFFLLSLFRDLFLYGVTKEGNQVYNKDLLDLFRSRKVNGKVVKEKFEQITKALSLLKYNLNRWAFIENLLISLVDES